MEVILLRGVIFYGKSLEKNIKWCYFIQINRIL